MPSRAQTCQTALSGERTDCQWPYNAWAPRGRTIHTPPSLVEVVTSGVDDDAAQPADRPCTAPPHLFSSSRSIAWRPNALAPCIMA